MKKACNSSELHAFCVYGIHGCFYTIFSNLSPLNFYRFKTETLHFYLESIVLSFTSEM